jgi:hypothetical protein
MSFSYLGLSHLLNISQERQDILDLFKLPPQGLKPAAISSSLGKSSNSIGQLLFNMHKDNLLTLRNGLYYLPTSHILTNHTNFSRDTQNAFPALNRDHELNLNVPSFQHTKERTMSDHTDEQTTFEDFRQDTLARIDFLLEKLSALTLRLFTAIQPEDIPPGKAGDLLIKNIKTTLELLSTRPEFVTNHDSLVEELHRFVFADYPSLQQPASTTPDGASAHQVIPTTASDNANNADNTDNGGNMENI